MLARTVSALLVLSLAACSSSSSNAPADASNSDTADASDTAVEASVDAGPDVVDAPAWTGTVDGDGWSITPPSGLVLLRHDAPQPIERWVFAHPTGEIVFSVEVSAWSGTLADYLASCRRPDAWGWFCVAKSTTVKVGALDGLELRVWRAPADVDAGANDADAAGDADDADAADAGPTPVGGIWRYVVVSGGRIWRIDVDDTLPATDREAALGTFAITGAE